MSFLTRFLLMLCVFAGLGTGMAHSYSHDAEDECATHCHTDDGKKLPGDSGDTTGHNSQEKSPHHHACCHFPSADRTMDTVYLPVSFRSILVEIPMDESLMPEGPFYSLDKPPLI